jgi:hypothetical protein
LSEPEQRTRGVVYTAGVDRIRAVFMSIYALREQLNSSLPVEVWGPPDAVFLCRKHVEAVLPHTTCRKLPSLAGGHTAKIVSRHYGVGGRFIRW